MVTLAGGVSQSNLSPMDVFMQQYGGNIAAASQGLPTFDLGISYSAPMQPVMPVYQPQATPVMPVQTSTTNAPVNVELSPVQQSSSNLSLAPINFPNLPGFTPEQAPGMIQIGGRQYPADSVIAQATQSFAPGVPQMDTMSDASAGYQATARPEQGQGYSLDAGQETLPDNFYGMPNPYMQRPVPQNYANSPSYQQAMNLPSDAINQLPQLNQFYSPQPAPQLSANPLSWLQRGIYAMPGQARNRAAQYADAKDNWQKALNAEAMIRQATLAPQINMAKEAMQQQGADYRLNAQAWNQGAQSMLEFNLDQQEKRILSHAQALDLAAQAFLLPSSINGQVNRQKLLYLNRAGAELGWSPADVQGLLAQQDMNAAEEFKQKSIKTEQDAFNLKKSREMLSGELNLLRAEVGRTNAQAANLYADANLANSQAQTNEFNLEQRQKVAKYERWSIIAKAIEDVANSTVARRTVNSRIKAIQAQNDKLAAETFRQRMEGNAVPVEAAGRIASAMAVMSNSTDPAIRTTAANLKDSLFGILGMQKQMVPVMQQGSSKVIERWEERPVNAPATVQQFNRSMQQMYQQQQPQQQPQPRYRRPAQPQPLPPQYFSGAPLSGGDFNQTSYRGD